MIRQVDVSQYLDRLSGRFILLWGWRRAACAILAGAATALAMPPVDAFLVPFLTLAVFIWLMDATAADPAKPAAVRFCRGFLTGWMFGFGYFLAGLWWIGLALLVEADRFALLLPVAVAGLPALLAAIWGLACGIAILAWREGWPRILWFAACLGAAEYLRGIVFTGFPWNEIGIAAMPYPVAMQSASVLGVSGVTLAAICVYGVGAAVPFRNGGARWFAMACGLAVVLHLGYGAYRLTAMTAGMAPDLTIRLVQPAIPQDQKWSTEFADRSFRTLLDLSSPGADPNALAGIALLVWPESAFAFVLTERPDALAAIARLLPDQTLLVTGALRLERRAAEGAARAFNSVYVIDGNGEIVASTDKSHLVPFGEYLPFAAWAEELGLSALVHPGGGFEAGPNPRPISIGRAGRMLALVCYEIIFSGLIAQSPRPDLILNVTNDAWFGTTPGPYQHWRQAVLRGVEFGLPVVRVANSGISSVSDPAGRVVARLPLGSAGSIDSSLPLPAAGTIYATHGSRPFYALILLFVLLGLAVPGGSGKMGRRP